MESGLRQAWWWGGWCAVVFVLFGSCAGHRESQAMGDKLGAGDFRPSVGLGIDALRAAGTDDGDINRYLAYANAVLGRPYQGYYVRPLEGWKVDASQLVTGKDVNDPLQTPPVGAAAPLIPYRDFLVEYPPGFFLLSVPPALATSDMDGYRILFSALMALLLSLALLGTTRMAAVLTPARAASLVPWAAGMALALGTISVRRYDASVSIALVGLAWGCLARQPLVAGVAFGVGVAAKGLPLLVAPLPILFWVVHRRWRDLVVAFAAALVVGLAIGLPFAQAAGAQILDMFAYHGQRPLQVESTGGALLIALRLLDPGSATLAQTYGSANVVGRFDALPRLLAGLLPLASLLAVTLWAAFAMRRSRHSSAASRDPDHAVHVSVRVLVVALCAALAGQMTLGKVFSPQYLTWLLPIGALASLLDGRRSKTSLVQLTVVFALTQLIYPFAYRVGLANALHPAFGLLVLARNLLVVVWAVNLVRGTEADAR